MLRTTKIRNSQRVPATFSLPPEAPDGKDLGRRRLQRLDAGAARAADPKRDGSRSVSIRVPGGRPVRFRYLAPGGHWFDDEHVAERDGGNCVVHL